jgi:hypothetical protein
MEHLTVDLDAVDLHTLLDAWQPRLGGRAMPMLVTALGDVFVQDLRTGRVSFLQASSGQVEAVCDSADALEELLENPEFVEHYFDPPAVSTLDASGLARGPDEVYALLVPGWEGGDWEGDNIVVRPVVEHFQRVAPSGGG